MTKEQERARARRRYESQQAPSPSARPTAPDGCASPPSSAPSSPSSRCSPCSGRCSRRRRTPAADARRIEPRRPRAAGCEPPPTALGTGAELTPARQGDRRGQDLRRDRDDELRRHRARPSTARRRPRPSPPSSSWPSRATGSTRRATASRPPRPSRCSSAATRPAPVRATPASASASRTPRRTAPTRAAPWRWPAPGPEEGQRRPVLPRLRRLHAPGPRRLHRLRHGDLRVGYCRQDRCRRGRPRWTALTTAFPAAPISILRVAVTEKKA